MESLLAAVRELLIRALPTFIIVFLLWLYLKKMLFAPLEKALQERQAATTGTRKRADESIQRAEAKAAEYEEKLRAARAEIYKEQEEMRRGWREEQTGRINETREEVGISIQAALAHINERKREAIAGLETESEALAEQITRTVLAGRAS